MPLVPAAPRGLLLIECRNRRDRGNVLLAAAMAIFSLHCLLVCPHGSSLLARRFVGFRRIISGIISRRWSARSWDAARLGCGVEGKECPRRREQNDWQRVRPRCGTFAERALALLGIATSACECTLFVTGERRCIAWELQCGKA